MREALIFALIAALSACNDHDPEDGGHVILLDQPSIQNDATGGGTTGGTTGDSGGTTTGEGTAYIHPCIDLNGDGYGWNGVATCDPIDTADAPDDEPAEQSDPPQENNGQTIIVDQSVTVVGDGNEVVQTVDAAQTQINMIGYWSCSAAHDYTIRWRIHLLDGQVVLDLSRGNTDPERLGTWDLNENSELVLHWQSHTTGYQLVGDDLAIASSSACQRGEDFPIIEPAPTDVVFKPTGEIVQLEANVFEESPYRRYFACELWLYDSDGSRYTHSGHPATSFDHHTRQEVNVAVHTSSNFYSYTWKNGIYRSDFAGALDAKWIERVNALTFREWFTQGNGYYECLEYVVDSA